MWRHLSVTRVKQNHKTVWMVTIKWTETWKKYELVRNISIAELIHLLWLELNCSDIQIVFGSWFCFLWVEKMGLHYLCSTAPSLVGSCYDFWCNFKANVLLSFESKYCFTSCILNQNYVLFHVLLNQNIVLLHVIWNKIFKN